MSGKSPEWMNVKRSRVRVRHSRNFFIFACEREIFGCFDDPACAAQAPQKLIVIYEEFISLRRQEIISYENTNRLKN